MENTIHNVSWPGWETIKLIGRGSFGAVYEIQRDVFGDIEKAALKVISIPQNPGDIDEMYSDGYDSASITSTFHGHLKSIVAEYSLMRKMNGSSNIVNCDDVRYVQHDDGIGWDIFIKMELLTPLTKALPAVIAEETVIKLAKDICTALELCKKHEIIHRDIKPQNIFVSPNGDYKLGDFGIAKTVEKTIGGTKIGTYKYMAPEVYNNQPYGSGADIYSLGLVLYWMLNERRMPFLPLPPEPLRAGADEEARYRRFSGEPIPAPIHGSPALQSIVLKACAYDPKARYHSAAQMLEDLNSLDGGAVIPPAWIPPVQVPPAPVFQESDQTVGAFWQAPIPEQKDAAAQAAPQAPEESDHTMGAFWQAPVPKQEPVPQAQTPQPAEEQDHTMGAFWQAPIPKQESGPQAQTPQPAEEQDHTVGAFWQAPVPKQEPVPQAQTPQPAEEQDHTMGAFWQAPIPKQEPVPQAQTPQPAEEQDHTMGAFWQAPIPKQEPVTQAQTPQPAKKQSDNKKKKLFIGGGIALAVLVIILLLLLRACGPSQDISTEPSTEPSNQGSADSTTEAPTQSSTAAPTEGTTAPTLPAEWSDWQENLPNTVTADAYEIEEQTLYRSRNLETTSSTKSSMSGWELYDTVSAGAGYGPWSSWSADKVSATDTRQVETQTMYRYRSKETTTSSSSTKSGWTLYDTTYTWGDYGAWSDWSTSAASASDSRQVETKTQYRYRDKSTTTSSSSALSGWTQYDSTTTYGSWSSWSDTAVSTTSTRDVQTQEVKTGTKYLMGHYCTGSDCDYAISWSNNTTNTAFNSKCVYHSLGWFTSLSDFKANGALSGKTKYEYYKNGSSTKYRCANTCFSWFIMDQENIYKTQYRYRDNTITYSFYKWGDWSSYSDTAVAASSTREVETRTVYRYRDRSQIPTYHFERWGSWSGWSADAVSASDTRQVETTPYYRYRDQAVNTTYYFRRWTEWSEFGTEALTPSDTTQVETKTQYRYKPKQ